MKRYCVLLFKTYSSLSRLVITSRWFATSRLVAPVSVRLVYCPILTCIYKQSIETSTLPSTWTKAFVAPAFKKGARCMPENYRPVSLTRVKILEHIICKHFSTYLEQYGILTTLNQGFHAKFSCETQLLLTPQVLLLVRDCKIQTDVAILDFLKAFDTVRHDCLFGKLRFFGIQGPLLD